MRISIPNGCVGYLDSKTDVPAHHCKAVNLRWEFSWNFRDAPSGKRVVRRLGTDLLLGTVTECSTCFQNHLIALVGGGLLALLLYRRQGRAGRSDLGCDLGLFWSGCRCRFHIVSVPCVDGVGRCGAFHHTIHFSTVSYVL